MNSSIIKRVLAQLKSRPHIWVRVIWPELLIFKYYSADINREDDGGTGKPGPRPGPLPQDNVLDVSLWRDEATSELYLRDDVELTHLKSFICDGGKLNSSTHTTVKVRKYNETH